MPESASYEFLMSSEIATVEFEMLSLPSCSVTLGENSNGCSVISVRLFIISTMMIVLDSSSNKVCDKIFSNGDLLLVV